MARLRRIFAAFALSSALALVLLDCAGGAEAPRASGKGQTRTLADAAGSPVPSPSSSVAAPLRPPNVYARLRRTLTTVPNAFSPDGRLVGLTSGDQCAIWDVATGLFRGSVPFATCEAWQQEGARRHDPKAIVSCKKIGCGGTIALSPKGDELAVHAGSGDDPIRIFDPASGAKRREVPLPPEATVTSGRVRLFWNDENLAAVLESSEGGHARVALFPGGSSPKSAELEYLDQATRLTFDPFGWLVLSHEQFFTPAGSGFFDRVIGLARKTRGTIRLDVGPPLDVKDEASEKPFVLPVARASFSADGRVIGLENGATIVRSPKVVVEAARTKLLTRAAVVSPDGSRVAFLATEADESRTNRVLVLQRVGDATAKEIHLPEGEVTAIEWSSDGRHLALRSSARLEVRDAETGAVEIFWARVAQMAWGADSTLAVEQEGRVQVRDVVTRAELFRLPASQKLLGRALSSRGDVLVTSGGGKITAWDATTGKRASEVAVKAKTLAVSSDGKLVVVGTTLDDVTVYETESGKKTLSLSPPPPPLSPSPSRSPVKPRPLGDIAFAGTKEIAAVDVDGRAVVWERSTGSVVRVLPRRVASTVSIAPTGDFFVDDAGDLVRTSDELAARVRPGGIAMTGGCISTFVGEAGDAGVSTRKAAQKLLAADLALLFGDVMSGVSESGAVMQDVLDEPRCADAFFSGGATVASALLADPRPPPAVVVDNAARVDGGTSPGSILVPIHVVDRAESATVVTIEPKVPAPDIVRWQLEPGGTPPEGRVYTMNLPADAGAYYSTSLTVTACNVSGGGLCALPVAKSVSVSLH
jgi:WD40 repeat protein